MQVTNAWTQLKRKLEVKVQTSDTNSKIPYRRQDLFNSEDSDRYASIWLLYRGSSFDHKPLGLFFSKQNIIMFLKKQKKKKSPLHDFVFTPLMGQGLKWCSWKE